MIFDEGCPLQGSTVLSGDIYQQCYHSATRPLETHRLKKYCEIKQWKKNHNVYLNKATEREDYREDVNIDQCANNLYLGNTIHFLL